MDSSLPDSSIYGIFQSRILEWVAISFSRGSSWPRAQTHISCTGRQFVTTEPPWKPQCGPELYNKNQNHKTAGENMKEKIFKTLN